MPSPKEIEVLAERIDGMEKARIIAYTELQRRLEELNHMRQEAIAKDAKFLPREAHEHFFNEYRQSIERVNAAIDKCLPQDQFEQYFRDFGHWRDEVNAKLAEQAGATANTRLWMAVITLVLLAVSVLGRWLLK